MEFSWHCQKRNSYKDNAHLFCINISHSQKKWSPPGSTASPGQLLPSLLLSMRDNKTSLHQHNGYSNLCLSRFCESYGDRIRVSQEGRMVRSQAGLGCCLALAPSATILIPSQPPQGRRQAASSQGQAKSYLVSQKIWRRHGVWLRRKTKGHCVELLLKNRANSGCLYCQPQTKAQGLSLTSFTGR